MLEFRMQGMGNDRPCVGTGMADRGLLLAMVIVAVADLALGADRYISVTAIQGCGVRRAVFGCFTGAIVERGRFAGRVGEVAVGFNVAIYFRSEEHTSELQSLMRISYAVFCLKKKKI